MPAIYHEGSWLGNATDPEVLVKDTVGWTGKNLLKNMATSQTINGVTFTVNADKSVTVNGTATNDIDFIISPYKKLDIENGYVFSGISNGSYGTYCLRIGYRTIDNAWISDQDLYDGSTSVSIPTAAALYQIKATIISGTTVSNLTFYPMIRRADITDPTYEPYHESVEEEIEQVYADNGVLGAKNLLNPSMTTQTRDGLTFTVNDDNTVTVNGTATASGGFAVLSTRSLSFDGCILNGNPSTDNTKVKLIYYDETSGRQFDVPANNGEVKISGTNGDNCRVVISYYNGATVSNLTFKPMLRLASDPDDTYQPYAMTNRELTEEKINIADLKTVVSASSDFTDFKTRIASL